MEIPTPLVLKGAPGSPYTRKMLAYLRYRHIPYEFIYDNEVAARGYPEPKVGLLPTFYLPDENGDIQAVVDSTPLIRRFEAAFRNRATLPPNPAMSFINYLIEDYADEWLTKAMFHYRWYYEDDIRKAAAVLPRWRGLNASNEQLSNMETFVSERQISRLYVVGSNDTTAPVIEESYQRFLKVFDAIIEAQTFVLGQRPSSADFGIYAQLTQLAKFDPTPAKICLSEAPRVYAWTDVVEDLSGQPAADDAWLEPADASLLKPLLAEVGRVYAPALIANARAVLEGAEQMETTIDGKPWVQPPFPYQAKCLQWIREAYTALDGDDKAAVDTLLADTGCEVLIS